MPIAPGTAGAVEGVAIYVGIAALQLGRPASIAVLALANVLVFAAGVWASNRVCKIEGIDDPRAIVADEISGQLISLVPLIFWSPLSIIGIVIGFALFRLFDIFKPYPIRKLERLHGGLGVMADDALAGVYAAVLLLLGHVAHLV